MAQPNLVLAVFLFLLVLAVAYWYFVARACGEHMGVLSDCPYGWAPSGGGCTPPATYTGPCQGLSTFGNYSDQDKMNWSAPGTCAAPWTPPCPTGWAVSPGGGCDSPASYTGPAQYKGHSSFAGYSEDDKADWAQAAGAPWPGYWPTYWQGTTQKQRQQQYLQQLQNMHSGMPTSNINQKLSYGFVQPASGLDTPVTPSQYALIDRQNPKSADYAPYPNRASTDYLAYMYSQ